MLYCYVGLRGSGKSAYAAKLSRKYLRKGITVYSNFELDGCYLYDVTDLGKYLIEDCVLILDEAGIDISNREYKNKTSPVESPAARRFWKKTRHYGINDIHVFSQAWDFSIVVRRLADRMYIIRRSILPHMSILRPVSPYWDVDDQGQPVVKWKLSSLRFKLFFRLPYYKYYDSFAVDELPRKEFKLMRSSAAMSPAAQERERRALAAKYKRRKLMLKISERILDSSIQYFVTEALQH